jgi:putative redox protein
VSDAPKTRTVTGVWQGGYRCEVAAGHHRIVIDEPESAGGGDTGPQPTDVFLASLSSCFTLAVYHVAKKRGIRVNALDVKVTGTYEGLAFRDLLVEVHLDADTDQADMLIERAKAVCYVSNTLIKGPTLTVRRTDTPRN